MRRLAAILFAGILAGTAWAQLPMHAPPLGTKSSVAAYVGPLDAISGAAAATVVSCWSFRACSASIATALTKAFSFTHSASHQDIKLLANGNLDVSSATTFCGGAVGSCTLHLTYDQTAAANTLTPASESGLNAAATCGVTSICVFVNGDGGMGINNAIGASFASTPETMSWVGYFKCVSCSVFGEAISMRTASVFSCDSGHNNSVNHVFNEGTSLFTATASDNAWHAVQNTVVSAANSSVINVDGTETTGSTGGCNGTPTTEIGVDTNPGAGGTLWEGWFVEAIVFSSALSGADRTALCRNQQAYYGTGNFPANC